MHWLKMVSVTIFDFSMKIKKCLFSYADGIWRFSLLRLILLSQERFQKMQRKFFTEWSMSVDITTDFSN